MKTTNEDLKQLKALGLEHVADELLELDVRVSELTDLVTQYRCLIDDISADGFIDTHRFTAKRLRDKA